MKLIRLTGANGLYDNFFDQDILIKKDSKISLMNLNFSRDFPVLTIYDENSNFRMRLSGEADMNSTLTSKIYTIATYKDFLTDMEVQLNKSIPYRNNSRVLGMVFLANNLNPDNWFNIRAGISGVNFKTDFINREQTSQEIEYIDDGTVGATPNISGILRKQNGVGDNIVPAIGYLDSNLPISMGCGVWYWRVMTLIDNNSGLDDMGGFIGLSTEPNDVGTITDFIEVIRPTQHIKVQCGSGQTPITTGFTIATNFTGSIMKNDVFECRVASGKVSLIQRIGGGVDRLLAERTLSDLEMATPLYPIFGIYGSNTNTTFIHPRITPDYFKSIIRKNFPVTSRTTGIRTFLSNPLYTRCSIPLNGRTVNNGILSIEFLDDDKTVRDFLGFDTYIHYLVDSGTSNYLITSRKSLKIEAEDDNYTVELLNIPLSSYDSTRRQRMNILATVPYNEKDAEGVIAYEPSNQYQINIDNTNDLTLRNIKARVLDKNLNPIDTKSNDIMTIIIHD